MNAPVDGELTQARFVIFARDPLNQPKNNLANIYGYPMEFHVWTDGVEGGADSFDENPQGLAALGSVLLQCCAGVFRSWGDMGDGGDSFSAGRHACC